MEDVCFVRCWEGYPERRFSHEVFSPRVETPRLKNASESSYFEWRRLRLILCLCAVMCCLFFFDTATFPLSGFSAQFRCGDTAVVHSDPLGQNADALFTLEQRNGDLKARRLSEQESGDMISLKTAGALQVVGMVLIAFASIVAVCAGTGGTRFLFFPRIQLENVD